ncbi:protein SCO1/2 [Candidatus Kryptonium thompsonii]|uniref:Protein SCO1/2 n=1 Tax=Candidatus Kryptonium thompsonii TaxID=1633631 RepID=A0A0P1LHG3_9BACT|nr:SCO family protein [Candidatus Kryptonium thompsoni]CUS78296.1 protein SCO1/2 [Candidatus Kryptonium thompsoni]CUS80937.1 protein SCO1/2 [Candidatus Kryptonium thompsoni]CUS81827.1 protein SCO1/2 [Candidatus Kryptonium thompsoni]CUS82291.1 protein SCO1/2 [Candidatus Kryptonium thompsoni]CUS94024.1 protein SCO1/2 [Candidatus Kryptonium thompsoni]
MPGKRIVIAILSIGIGIFIALKIQIWKVSSAAILPTYGEVPEFSLIDHHGQEINLEKLKGSVFVADFFFTSCAGICPRMTEQMTRVQEAFKDEQRVKLVSFTVDPERDSVWVLSEYAKGWGAIDGKWFFITGEKKKIYELARKGFKLPVEEGDGGPNDFIHSDRFVLVDSKGRIRGYYSGTDPEDVDKLIRDVKLVLREK